MTKTRLPQTEIDEAKAALIATALKTITDEQLREAIAKKIALIHRMPGREAVNTALFLKDQLELEV